MTSFIIVSQNVQKAFQEGQNVCEKEKIHRVDQTILGLDENAKKSIGVAEIRTIQKKLYFKPIQSPQKAIIINQAETLTIEAQNALLKVLEEPPANTIIILLTTTKEIMLPTICSRCTIIELKNDIVFIDDEQNQILKVLDELNSKPLGEKLRLAQEMGKNKEETLEWLRKSMIVLRKEIIERGTLDEQKIELIKRLQKIYIIIKTTNSNARFALETLFIPL